jgi:hypothetical protein
MTEYEITIQLPDGDWQWWRGYYADFHDAALAGIDRTGRGSRLLRIERVRALTLEDVPHA